MRVARILCGSVLLVLLLGGVAMADYVPASDRTVSVQLLPGLVSTTSLTGSLLFGTQEAVHTTVTGVTGITLDHSYTWVDVNGEPVLAVDPLCVYEFE